MADGPALSSSFANDVARAVDSSTAATGGWVRAVAHACRPGAPTTSVPLSELATSSLARLDGANEKHARVLADSQAQLPPILVQRKTMRVIDGLHRVRAAELLGHREIDAFFFDGSDDDAYILSVGLNVTQGLPLTLADRSAAATTILHSRPEWSDRMIASTTGLAATTIGAIRSCSTAQIEQSNTRLGRDGRIRPVNSAGARKLASELIAAHPETSLREIARVVGLAPSTVCDVRQRMRDGRDPTPARTSIGGAARSIEDRCVDSEELMTLLRQDPSLRFSNVGRSFLVALDHQVVDSGWFERVSEHLPEHLSVAAAQLIRENVRMWSLFAGALERRSAEIRH